MKRHLLCAAIMLLAALFFSCATDDTADIINNESVESTDTIFEYEGQPVGELITLPNGLIVDYRGGNYHFETDILIPEEELEEFGSISGRSVYYRTSNVWPNKIVYYKIDASIPDSSAIKEGMKMWTDAVGIRFIPVNNTSPAYILFIESDVNNSEIGMGNGMQKINLSNWGSRGTVAHEIGHALGLMHEHTHPNRDEYITIHWDDINPINQHNFVIYSANRATIDELDFNSIMMYSAVNSFGTSRSPTMTKKSDGTTWTGQRMYISVTDAQAVRKKYNEADNDLLTGPAEMTSDQPATYTLLDPGTIDRIVWKIDGVPVTSDGNRYKVIGQGTNQITITPIDPVRVGVITVEFYYKNTNHSWFINKTFIGNSYLVDMGHTSGQTVNTGQTVSYTIQYQHPDFRGVDDYGNPFSTEWYYIRNITRNEDAQYSIRYLDRDCNRAQVVFHEPGEHDVWIKIHSSTTSSIKEHHHKVNVRQAPGTVAPPENYQDVEIMKKYTYGLAYDESLFRYTPQTRFTVTMLSGGTVRESDYHIENLGDDRFTISFWRNPLNLSGKTNYNLKVDFIEDGYLRQYKNYIFGVTGYTPPYIKFGSQYLDPWGSDLYWNIGNTLTLQLYFNPYDNNTVIGRPYIGPYFENANYSGPYITDGDYNFIEMDMIFYSPGEYEVGAILYNDETHYELPAIVTVESN